MKILICGSTGMVGKNLVELAPKEVELLIPNRLELDLSNYELTFDYLVLHKPDLIINCAGIVGGIQANMSEPVRFLLENIDINRNVIWAAFNSKVKNVLNLGSSCMYPRSAINPIKETEILNGELEPTNEGYAIAKIMTQRLCSYINRQYSEFHYKTIIPCNLYGKFDKFDPKFSHMIPAVIARILDSKNKSLPFVEIWGDGTARREFMFVEDLATIIWEMVDRFEEIPELMNVGLGKDYSIAEYYKKIAAVIGYEGQFKFDLSKPIGMKQKLVDNSIQTNLGFSNKYTLEEGISKTYNYYLTTLK